jgi:hypothetical protein
MTNERRLPVWTRFVIAAWILAVSITSEPAARAAAQTPAPPQGAGAVSIRSFQPVPPVCRAGRVVVLAADIANAGERPTRVRIRLLPPPGVRLVGCQAVRELTILDADWGRATWRVQAGAAGVYAFRVVVLDKTRASARLSARFLAAVPMRRLGAIPPPKPVRVAPLIGVLDCPLWESDRYTMWANILKHPERTPALGFYAQENPQVSDWETKWAVEHGISFFVYCWYRDGQSAPVRQSFGSAIHKGLFHSRFGNRVKFAIMWTNEERGVAGVSGEKDLFDNLFPYWLKTYFKRPNYLKVDNRPVLFIYRPEYLIEDLGGVEKVRAAFERMRQECAQAGFAGLTILGEYRGTEADHLKQMRDLGLDYTFAYCWWVPNSPPPAVAIRTQMDFLAKTRDLNLLPMVPTVSQAWSGWNDENTIWKIPPADYRTLLRQTKAFMATLPREQLGSHMLLLDNWNEWGEGHYIAPYREFGFGYLDAIRAVFSSAPAAHTDLLPEDVGLGPYDKAYRAWAASQATLARIASRKAIAAGANERGLVARWTFDEPAGFPVAQDWSGHRLGGILVHAHRGEGVRGKGLICNGGCVEVPANPLLCPPREMTLECWVKTDRSGQRDNWIANRIYSGATSTGYRFGISHDRLCFEIPLTEWSHHLVADRPLPLGRWVHLAGTFDGHVMRVYVDGEEAGRLDREGPIHPNDFNLCLGSFDVGHRAHFEGLLDEVRLYSRALSAAEIQAHAAAAGK